MKTTVTKLYASKSEVSPEANTPPTQALAALSPSQEPQQAFLGWQQASWLQQQERLQTSNKKEDHTSTSPGPRLQGTRKHGTPRGLDNIFSTKLIFPQKWSAGAPETSSQEKILFICYVIDNPLGSAVPIFPAPSTLVWLLLRP